MSSRARCPRCGEGVRGAPAFCPTCGTRLAGADAPAVEVDLFGDGVSTTAGSTELVFDAPGRRRGRTVGAGVAAVLALAVGVSVAAGGGSGQTRAPTSTTTPATTSTTTASVWISPSTTSDAPTTTTTLGPVSLGAGPLFGETTGLSALTMLSSDLYRIDLDTGIAVPVPNGPVSGDAVQGILTSIGLLVGDQNGSLRLVRAGSTGPTPLIGAGPGGADVSLNGASYIGEGPPGRLWLMTYDEHGQHVGYVEPLRDGGFGEVPMAVSTGGARADGLGALLFTAPGGAYRVEPGGSPRRFREGYVVGATAGRALTLECDASLHCAWTVVALATGDSWSVAAQGDASSSLYNGSALLSPDGAHVVITSPVDPLQPSNRTRFQIYDRNGLVVVFEQDMFATSFCSPLGCGSSAAWSTDGTWLLGLGSSDTMWGWRPGLAAPILAQLPSPSDGHRLLFSGLLVGGPTDGLPV